MSDSAQKIVDDIMRQVEEGDQREPGRRTISYSFTLTDQEEVKAGPQIYQMFLSRLHAYFGGAKITSKGYSAGGYNILARVDR
ncbi:hypothetical protein SAMN03159444_01419 [Pseudomonas sp. NFACC02]|uniref:hypothetical protein n=1 Tax=Pseudomonas sp. NFACC02 TaxID=1566250 RepID=UPI0008B482E3|nr:hypothetical protein [Pseudomonas sp. NFACC02]SEQ28558.1 hypothetical protein SAMN03159444_01419 [Pseudomonas sp. NFACC02]